MNQRRVIVLTAVVGMNTADIAKELSASEATIRVWLMRARATITGEFAKDSEGIWKRSDISAAAR